MLVILLDRHGSFRNDFVKTPSTLKGLLFRWRSWLSGTAPTTHDTVDGSEMCRENHLLSTKSPMHIFAFFGMVMDWPVGNPIIQSGFFANRICAKWPALDPRYCGLLGVLCWGSGRRRSPHDGGWLVGSRFWRGRNGGETAAEWFSGCCFLLILEMMRTGDGKYSVWCFCWMFNLADYYVFVTRIMP